MPSNSFQIFDQMMEGVQVVDRDGRYLYVNNALVNQGKKSRKQLIGHSMTECYPGIENTILYSRIQECLKNRKPQEFLNEFVFPDGSKGFFQLRMHPVNEGVLIMSFDVTKEKAAEELLINAKEYLEEVVKTRTEELQEQKLIIENQLQYLKDLNATKDKFFSIVSHDLISPLQSLKGLLSLVNSQASLSPDQLIKTISSLQTSVDNTLELAQNLLAWAGSQMNSLKKPQLEPVKVSDMIQEVYGLYKDLANRKGVSLEVQVGDELFARADRSQLTFVVRNLVNNAIKFSHSNGVVKVTAEEIEDDNVLIAVADNGIGIPKSIIERIRNQEVDRSVIGTSGEKGTGLGLLLCNEFMKQNDGHIEIESEEGIGSKFNLYLKADS